MEYSKRELLEAFGKLFIEKSRDLTIREELKILEGTAQSPSSKKMHDRVKNFSPDQIEIIKDLIIDSIDGALNNFMWLLEQEDKIDLVSSQNEKVVSLKDISDGLSVDYWNFVDEFSHYKRVD